MKIPTERQKTILSFIKSYITNHHYPPTIREIAHHFSISVKGSHDHVKALEKKGLIACGSKRSRAIEIISAPSQPTKGTVPVPLLKRIDNESALLTEQEHDNFLILPISLVGIGRVFALQVNDENMIDAGILNGDIAVFRQKSQVGNGEIILLKLEQEIVLKRFFQEKNRVRLQSENATCLPIYISHVRIIGSLVTIIRSYDNFYSPDPL